MGRISRLAEKLVAFKDRICRTKSVDTGPTTARLNVADSAAHICPLLRPLWAIPRLGPSVQEP